MARQFLTNLDMQGNQVLNLVVQKLSAAPSAAPLSVVQHYGASASSGPSGVASTCLTSNCTIGNAVVLEIFVGGAGTVASISSPIGTFVKGAAAATSNGDTEQWWCKNATAAASVVTVNTTSGSFSALGVEVAGGAVSMTATSYNLGAGSPSMSVAATAGDVVIALAGADSAGFTTAPTSPWTNLNGSGLWAVSDALDYAWQVLATSGTVTAAWSQVSNPWQGVIVDLAAPGPTAGTIYYDTTLNQFGVYNGTGWVYLGASSGVTFPAAAFPPSSPTIGQGYYDTQMGMAAYWTGTNWFYLQSPESLVLAKMAFR